VFSRYLVIALAFIAAGIKAQQGAIVEATGLFGLGAGLVLLKLGGDRPILRFGAYCCFAAVAVSMAIVFIRYRYAT
jgi:hypothetical protein